jgi:hypothetical protein
MVDFPLSGARIAGKLMNFEGAKRSMAVRLIRFAVAPNGANGRRF